ncbi:MAG: hypothetical protein GX639_11545 [Fibrobacter sp.]|nr:hypothetical protein [Fibrobacter sp.]
MDEIQNILCQMVEKKCWSVVAGKGTGSAVAIDIGGKIQRKKPLTNPYLTEEQRQYQCEYGLLIDCSWRLDSSIAVICSSKDSNEEGGVMLSGLKELINQRIVSVEVFMPAIDLQLHFDNEMTLKVFCDETNDVDMADNFTFITPKMNYTVGTKSQVALEARHL